MSIKTKLMTACAGVVLAGASIASANLVIDLRVAGVNGAAVADNKWVPVLNAGDIVDINIYAIVSGKNTGYERTAVKSPTPPFKQTGWAYTFDGADGFQSISGSVLTHPSMGGGAVKADGTSLVYNGDTVAAFNALGSTGGDNVDLTGDGIADLGAPNGTSDGGKYVNFRAGLMVYDPAAPTVDAINALPSTGYTRPANDPATREFLIGKIGFFVGTPTGGATEINWALRSDQSGKAEANAGLWEEDRLLVGATKESDPMNGQVGQISVGAPIVVGPIPEPMSLSIMGIGAALLGFRRSRR